MHIFENVGTLGCDPLTKYQAAQQYLQVTAKFEADHSQDYCGTAVIIAQSRKTSEVKSHLKLTSKLQKEHPDFFIGTEKQFCLDFDLIFAIFLLSIRYLLTIPK